MIQLRSFVVGFAAAVALASAIAVAQQKSFDDTVVTTVNGEPITRRQMVERLLEYHGEAALQAMVNQALTRQAASQREVAVTDAEVEQKLNEVKSKIGKDFNAFLVSSSLTEALYREQIRYTLLAEKTALKIDPIKSEDLDQIQVRVILCRDENHAKAVVRQLSAPNIDFGVIALQESQDPASKGEGGLLPPFFRIDYQDIWHFASKLQPSQFTREPAPVQGGQFLIIKLEKRIPAAQVKPQEKERAIARIKSYKIDRLLEELHERAKIEYPVALKDIIREPAPK
ncbi:MAG: hypothetical protein HY320_10685 [Armatimonadetes bacterium]|nr:hypothetical protein [Armatimonadota bacterium]